MEEAKVYIVVDARDAKDDRAPARRAAAREAQYERYWQLYERGELISGGSLVDLDGNIVGSSLHLAFDDEQVFHEWFEDLPFIDAGVWGSITIHRLQH